MTASKTPRAPTIRPNAVYAISAATGAPDLTAIRRELRQRRAVKRGGKIYVLGKALLGEPPARESGPRPADPPGQLKPRWVGKDRRLYIGDDMVEKLQPRAIRLMPIYHAFQNAGWPEDIPLEEVVLRDEDGEPIKDRKRKKIMIEKAIQSKELACARLGAHRRVQLSIIELKGRDHVSWQIVTI